MAPQHESRENYCDSGFISGFVTLTGWTNVGKSTLLNRLVGQKIAIVSPKPQTTRNRITGIRSDDNSQIVFIDTPGFHHARNLMSKRMLRTAMLSIDGVDVIAAMTAVDLENRRDEKTLFDEYKKTHAKKILLVNKIDLVPKSSLLPLIAEFADLDLFEHIIPISAISGDNVNHAISVLKSMLPNGPRYFESDSVTDVSERFLAAELVREVILKRIQQEVPYCTTVQVDAFEEPCEGRRMEIYASVVVEKTSQKAIIIGKGGQSLKAIGTQARLEIERVFGQQVILKLWVKVQDRWRSDASWLNDIGINGS